MKVKNRSDESPPISTAPAPPLSTTQGLYLCNKQHLPYHCQLHSAVSAIKGLLDTYTILISS